MEIRVFATNADLPDHLRWQIISIIRMEWHEAAGDYTGPPALPDDWHPCHVVGTEGDARFVDYYWTPHGTFPSDAPAGGYSQAGRLAPHNGDAIGIVDHSHQLRPSGGWQ